MYKAFIILFSLAGALQITLFEINKVKKSEESFTNSAPLISPIKIDNKILNGVYFDPGSIHHAHIETWDPDMDKLNYKWHVYKESKDPVEGESEEELPDVPATFIVKEKGKRLSFKAPLEEGTYRLFVFVFDGNNNIATSNTPFYVKK